MTKIKISSILLYIFLFEALSFLGFLFPEIRQISFFAIIFLFLIACLKDLKFGFLILLAELFIGSKGYLFYFESNGLIVSIRIAFWLIILSVWLAKEISSADIKKYAKILPAHWIVFFIFIGWGVLNGFFQNNSFENIFFDFNNWLYFALIFPLFSAFKTKKDLTLIWEVFLASIIWLILKTFFLLFLFSRNIPELIEVFYRWVRSSGVGEITLIENGFYRIFFQSHIYNLVAFFALGALILKKIDEKKIFNKQNVKYHLLFIANLSIILISFSRSFWVGLSVALFCFAVCVAWWFGWKTLLKITGIVLLSSGLSFVLISAVVNFPYPPPLSDYSASSLISERAKRTSDEAAVSSRWNLLPELWNEIKKAPIMGSGLGTVITYESSDPRVLETTADGKFTTYAFEWGWLDIWLKFGLLGLLAYLVLFFKMLVGGLFLFKKDRDDFEYLILGLLIGLISLMSVNFFTPYLNHPLGIGFLILLFLTLNIRFLKNT